jgi:hypothetical protein
MWTKEVPTGHITPQIAPIISCEVQTGEAHKCTSNLQQNFGKEKCQIKNVGS